MDTQQGSCLCGEITFEVTGQPVRQGNCHCTVCKKATGAAYATIVFFNVLFGWNRGIGGDFKRCGLDLK